MSSQEFDYVVLGGGSAGSLVAARLSQDKGERVLLLEAGPRDHGLRFRVPAAFGIPSAMRPYKWPYTSEPEPHLNGRRLPVMMGRVLGGSSSVNGMIYNRGHRSDYDSWKEMGCEGWSYDELLPFFRAMENNHDRQDAYHGSGGDLDITAPTADLGNPLNEAFLHSGLQAGYSRSPDFDGASQEGFGYFDRTIFRGTRSSSASAFLRNRRRFRNLTIMTGAVATRIGLEGRRATTVEYRHSGKVHEARAAREIILCAGSIATPQLLMLSGIGPAEHLEKHGITVRHHLPGVGENLQNHADLALQFGCSKGSVNSSGRHFGKGVAGLRWMVSRTGAAATNHFAAGAFVRTSHAIPYPDIKLSFLPMALDPAGRPIQGHGFQVHIGLIRPTTFGSVRLRSASPDDAPEIRFDYLSHAADLDALQSAVAIVRNIVAQPAFSPYDPKELRPGPEICSDAAVVGWIRAALGTSHHPVGTCKMGRTADPLAVVDSELRVIGVSGLRIADGSVMPRIVAGNTNGPIMMIGEKFASLMTA